MLNLADYKTRAAFQPLLADSCRVIEIIKCSREPEFKFTYRWLCGALQDRLCIFNVSRNLFQQFLHRIESQLITQTHDKLQPHILAVNVSLMKIEQMDFHVRCLLIGCERRIDPNVDGSRILFIADISPAGIDAPGRDHFLV